MKVGIDFDRVLFDTDAFNEYMKENVEGLHHVDTEPYDEHGCYSPEMHAELCGIPVERIYDVVKDVEKFLFDDVEDLEQLDVEKVIVTRGESRFQMAKIQGSGAGKFFDDIIVVEEGSKDVGDIDFLVDDREVEIERAGVPGFVFDRQEHSMEDVVEAVKNNG